MNQQPDKLFREKLETFHKPSPATAWEKIEAGLQKKDNKTFWFRIAAAILLIAVAAVTLWTTLSAPTQQVATKTSAPNKEKPAVKKMEPNVVTPQPDAKEVPLTKRVIKKRSPSKRTNPSQVTPLMEEPAMIEETIMPELAFNATDPLNTSDSTLDETKVVAEEPVVVASTEEEEEKEEKEESRVLVFSVEEVDAKYLDKEALAKATSAQKKPSTFRKLLNKAYDLKNNQDPFGDLRQKKNEILALNFKSEKRSQNK